MNMEKLDRKTRKLIALMPIVALIGTLVMILSYTAMALIPKVNQAKASEKAAPTTTSELLSDIALGSYRGWIEERLGTPRFIGEKGDFTRCAYVSDSYVVQIAYDTAEAVQAFLLTELNTFESDIVIEEVRLPEAQTFPLGEATFYEYPGKPCSVLGYVSNGASRGLYVEEYYLGAQSNYQTYFLASVDFGRLPGSMSDFFRSIRLGLTYVDDEVTEETIETGQTLADRKGTCPNSYGVALDPSIMYEQLLDYTWFDSMKIRSLYNYDTEPENY